ncbi:uncharacterized protein ACO6RY_12781 [Pungitius sinensis]
MGKAKAAVLPEERRFSKRLAAVNPPKAVEAKKKPAVKKALKAKKTKLTENGGAKAEEPKAEAAEAK